MSRLLARIMLALLMLPLAAVIYLVVFVTLIRQVFGYSRDIEVFAITSLACWAFVAAYWVVLWRSTVRWTPNRIVLTFVAVVVAMIPAVLTGFAAGQLDDELGAFVGGITAPLIWLCLTVIVWSETRAERAARVRASAQAMVCPTCGYNMTGLRELTCPECGSRWTIEEIRALQPGSERELQTE
jgi:predicted RNA-binding Zn-ribbon protein involved in translation (DUF1610 family)